MGLHQRQIALESIKDQNWSGKKILDIGCSNGKLSSEIMKITRAEELVGIDTAMDRIAKASKMAKENSSQKLSFFLASADNLKKIEDSGFDIIFCNMAFQQFKNKAKALQEMQRVLKNEGEAFINFNIEKSPTWMEQEVVYEQLFGDPKKVITKEKTFDSTTFKPMAKEAGFSNISILIKDNTFYYNSFEEAIDMMDMSYFAKKKGLTKEQDEVLNKELKKLLENKRTNKGIPETWKILFAKLTK